MGGKEYAMSSKTLFRLSGLGLLSALPLQVLDQHHHRRPPLLETQDGMQLRLQYLHQAEGGEQGAGHNPRPGGRFRVSPGRRSLSRLSRFVSG